MTSTESFSCFQFHGGDTLYLLPTIDIRRVHNSANEGPQSIAPHICSVVGMGEATDDLRLLELGSEGVESRFLVVDAPVCIADVAISRVVRGSVKHAGFYAQGVVDGGDKLMVLLDSEKIRQALERLSADLRTVETEPQL